MFNDYKMLPPFKKTPCNNNCISNSEDFNGLDKNYRQVADGNVEIWFCMSSFTFFFAECVCFSRGIPAMQVKRNPLVAHGEIFRMLVEYAVTRKIPLGHHKIFLAAEDILYLKSYHKL